MKITNFKFLKRTGKDALDWVDWAEVDCITGALWWKKIKTRMVRKEYALHWHFVDNGQWCPGYEVDSLYRAWKSQNSITL